MNWEQKFELAKAYYEHYGHLRIVSSFKTKDGYTYDENGFELGDWINDQRRQYKIKGLTQEHYAKLKSIGMIFESLNEYEWERFYNLAKVYLEHYGNLSVPNDFRTKNGYERDEEGKNLGAWINVQRFNYRHKKICEQRMVKLTELFNLLEEKKKQQERKNDLEWERMYNLARAYYQHFGNLKVPRSFKTKNGYEKDAKGSDLGAWVCEQRNRFRNNQLSVEKIKKLEQIELVFLGVLNAEWERMYNLAKAYYEHCGNLKVPRSFKTKNGYEYDENGSNLGRWLNTQYCRKVNGLISEEEKTKLESIGMVLENQRENRWSNMYSLAKIYYQHHKNLNVPTNFKTLNGYSHDDKGFPLGTWLNLQRKLYLGKKLSKRHVQLLKEIGMVLEKVYVSRWNKMYELAKIYYEHHNNLSIDYNFITDNGYSYSAKGEKLGAWIYKQSLYYRDGSLQKDREEKLRKIGMVFKNLRNVKWDEMYALAVSYYRAYNNLGIYTEFRTENGVDYNPNGARLGEWIAAQRRNYKNGMLSQERIDKLQVIGMLFNLRKDKEENQITCITHDIDYKKFKKQIDKIPHREFIAKINFLNNEGIPVVSDDQLHPIFFMSSINMEVRYGVNLKQLIDEYQESLKKVKKV